MFFLAVTNLVCFCLVCNLHTDRGMPILIGVCSILIGDMLILIGGKFILIGDMLILIGGNLILIGSKFILIGGKLILIGVCSS